jgi:colicin import membrane protein
MYIRYKKIMDRKSKTKLFCLFLSLLFHVVFFGSTLILAGLHVTRPMNQVIRVDLISLPALTKGDKSIEKKQQQNTKSQIAESSTTQPKALPAKKETISEIKNEAVPKPEIKPDIRLKDKPKNLKELLAEQEKKEKDRKKEEDRKNKEMAAKEAARKKAEKAELEKQNERRFAESLEKLKKTVANQNKSGQEAGDGEEDGVGTGYQGSLSTGSGYLEQYQRQIALIIQENWIFNDVLAGINRNIKVQILIKIMKNGEIKDIRYENRSGNQYLDDSARRAIVKANPLPQLPYGMDSYEIGFIFTPKGVL